MLRPPFQSILAIFAVFVIFCFANLCFSQTYFFDKYDVRAGLAQSKVYSIVQDKQGFVWAGTAIGLSRFDGVNFQNYSTESGLAENGVKTVFIDSRGYVWLGHIGGGLSRNIGNGFEKLESGNFTHDVTGIFEDKEGKIWFVTVGDGAKRIENPSESNVSKLKSTLFSGKNGLSDNIFNAIARNNGNILFVTDMGLKRYNSQKNSFEFYKPKAVPGYFMITCVYEDKNQILWLGTHNGGLYRFNEKVNELTTFDATGSGLAHNWISTIRSDSKGNIWVGTWGGGISVIQDKKVKENFSIQNGLHDNKIWNITEDREGNILLGTNENGLLIYKGKKFVSYNKNNGLVDNQVWAINGDNAGNIWFGTNSGITTYSVNTNSYKSYTTDNSKLVSNQIRYLRKDNNGNIWIGTNDNGIQLYNVRQKDFTYDPLINRYFPSSNSVVTALEVDKDNNLWIGTTEWLIYYEIDKKKITSLSRINGLAGNDISTIFCDSKNNVWVGSKRSGLTKIAGEKITRIDLKESFTPKCITEDSEGKLWVGTEDRGLIILKDDNILKRYKIADGLLSNNIMAIIADENGNIFIGTSAGLNKYMVRSDQFQAYSEKSGFTGIEVKEHSSYKDHLGNLWFGTVHGAFVYNKQYDIPNSLEPLTFINRFRVNLQDRPMKDGLVLNHRDRSITFDFGSICLSNADGIKYLFQLVGADPDWRPVVKNLTSVTYSLLPHGSYTFRVKASNNDGVWNSNPVSFNFIIKPPFWKTIWFYLLLIALLGASIFTYVKLRIRNLVNDKKKLESKVKARTAEVVMEKEKSEALLLNTLPAKVVEELKKKGKTEPESFEDVTVMFSDLCNFTTITSKLDPKETIDELNEMFTAFDDIMLKHNCERIKTLGDGYMAVCGLPEKDENHALNIARAAIEVVEYLKQRAETSKIQWLIRIGINSGTVTGGIVGVRKYLYDIFGDTVNIASRMESNSDPMKINCSETTYSILKNKFRFTSRGTALIKGKGEMNMYFIEEEIINK